LVAMTHIMVDCETTDTDPARGGVIQLSGIKLSLDTLRVGEMFDGCPSMLGTRRWSEQTRKFWRVDNKEVYADIVAREQPARDVFQAFADFCCKDAPFGGYTFIAKPLKFDWPFIESHFIELGIPFPFAHHNYLDMNSYIMGLQGLTTKSTVEDIVPFPAGGKKHNSLHDCAWQIDCLFHAKRNHVGAEIVQ
jgi:hypothetical protein